MADTIKPIQRFELQAEGDLALFSIPEYKMKGSFTSYPVPTYEAILNMVKQVYWKPTIDYVIEAVRVMNKIQMVHIGQRLISWGSYSPRRVAIAYLKNVCYQVKGYFIWNEDRPDMIKDRIPEKHSNELKTAIKRGGRQNPHFGTSECRAFIKPCVFGEGESFYDDYDAMYFGRMEHGFTYPKRDDPDQTVYERFWLVNMENGIINYIKPEECEEITAVPKGPVKKRKAKEKKNAS